MICENKVFVHGQPKGVADFGHDFGLFDRVNPEFALQVLVQFNEVGRIARMSHHNGHHGFGHACVLNNLRRFMWRLGRLLRDGRR